MGKLFKLGTVALVTGASRGLGKAIAIEMAKEGADIIVNYCSNESKALEVKNEIEKIGKKALLIKGDVSSNRDVKDMFKIIKKEFGHLNIVVNNAGIIRDGFLMMMSEKNFFDVLNTNMGGCFRVTQEALRMMCKEKQGSIIHIVDWYLYGVKLNQSEPPFCVLHLGEKNSMVHIENVICHVNSQLLSKYGDIGIGDWEINNYHTGEQYSIQLYVSGVVYIPHL